MNLAERIKGMTDRALFERLANAVLRQKFPGLTNLIAGGINAKGETIKGKLDAFAQSEEKHFILIEHTTNDSGLEGKWLYDQINYFGKKEKATQSDGDLVKAIKQAELIKQSINNAKFTVYLTSNQNVDSDLWTKVVSAAAIGGVSVELLELSAIADHLNFTPQGQYLRKEFFGINYELLSEAAFLEIQTLSLKSYGADTFIEPAKIQATAAVNLFKAQLDVTPKQLTVIIANSGLGKSVLCYTYMAQLHECSTAALRVTPELVDNAADLNLLIRAALTYHLPGLHWDTDAQTLVKAKPLFIFVDDLNNFNNPLRVLDKLVAWSFAATEAERQIKVICPIWPQFFQQLPALEKKKDWFAVFRLKKPTPAFAVEMLRKSIKPAYINLSPLQEETVVRSAGYDPLLIAMYAELIVKNGGYAINQSTTVIGDFIRGKLQSVASLLRIPILPIDNVLQNLGAQMFTQKTINPAYVDVVNWMGNLTSGQKIIDELTVQGELWTVRDNGHLQFRHDRVRNYLLTNGIRSLITDLRSHSDAFNDPFFAPQIGLAISQIELNEVEIDKFLKANPQSIFHTLGYLQSSNSTPYFERILATIIAWKNSTDFDLENDAVLHSLLFDLLDTDTKKIRSITDKLPTGRLRYMAEMRNGDLLGAIQYFASHGDFEPQFGNPQRNDILRHIEAHHPGMSGQLNAALQRTGWESIGRRGAYLLAGYLRDTSLLPALFENWRSAPNEEIFAHLLWGILHCCNEPDRDKTNELLAYFNTLPNQGNKESGYPRGIKNTILYLFPRLRWRLTNDQVVILDSLYDSYNDLIGAIFSHIDHPLAIARTTLKIGENLDKYPSSFYANMQPDDRWSFKKNKYRLSDASRQAVRDIWADTKYSKGQRHVAFRFWTDNETADNAIEGMRSIGSNDAQLYDDAIWRRALHGDHQVTAEFLPRLLTDKFHWIRIIQYIWNEECKACYQQLIDQNRKGPIDVEHLEDFTEVLREIPQADGTELLINNWSFFERDEAGIQTALFLATEHTLALAASVIKLSPNPEEYFDHISQRFGCYNNPKEELITLEKLRALEPYLGLLSEYSRNEFAEQCFRSHFQDWLYTTLFSHLDEKKQRYYKPAIADLIAEIDEKLSKSDPFLARHWLEELRRRQIPVALTMQALEQWCSNCQSIDGLKFLGDCLIEIGSRTDLNLLDVYQVAGDNNAVNANYIREATKYDVRKRSLN